MAAVKTFAESYEVMLLGFTARVNVVSSGNNVSETPLNVGLSCH
jgi:hypothetical protein